MKPAALLALFTALAAPNALTVMPVHAQTTDSAAAASAEPIPQSDSLTALEDDFWVDVRAGDAPYDRVYDATDGKAEPVATCKDIQDAYTAYNSAYGKMQGIVDAITADTVMPEDAKAGEIDDVNEVWDSLAYALYDLEDLGTTYNCFPV